MASDIKVLLQNGQVNVQDDTNFPNLPAVKGAYIMDDFALLRSDDFYVVLTLAGVEPMDSLGTFLQVQVKYHFCYRRKQTPRGENAIEQLLDDMDEWRKALDRPDPYGAGNKPDENYTTMAGCKGVLLTDFEYPHLEATYLDGDDGDAQLVGALTFQYNMATSRT